MNRALAYESKRRARKAVTPVASTARPMWLQLKDVARKRRQLAELNNAGNVSPQLVVREKMWKRRRGGMARAADMILGVTPNAAGVLVDPTHVVAYKIRDALRPIDLSRRPSACRRIDPVTGRVIGLIDPVTREERAP